METAQGKEICPSQLWALMSFSNLSHFSHPLNGGNIIKVAARIFWSPCKEPTITRRYVTLLLQIIDPWVHWLLCSRAHKLLGQPWLQCCCKCCHFYLYLWSRICIGRSYRSQSPSRSPRLSLSPAKRGTRGGRDDIKAAAAAKTSMEKCFPLQLPESGRQLERKMFLCHSTKCGWALRVLFSNQVKP